MPPVLLKSLTALSLFKTQTMEATTSLCHRHQPLQLSLHRHQPLSLPLPRHHRPSFTIPISSLSFTTPNPQPFSSVITSPPLLVARASSSEPLLPDSNPPKKTRLLSLMKKTLLSLVAAASVASVATISFKMRSYFDITNCPVLTEAMLTEEDNAAIEEQERAITEHLKSHPEDSEALRVLLDLNLKRKDVDEAIGVLEKLIKLDPGHIDWTLMKYYLYCYKGKTKTAKLGFSGVIKKDLLQAQAYHGLILAASSDDDSEAELKEIKEKIGEAIEICKKDGNKRGCWMNFRILLAQIHAILENYDDATELFQELVKECPHVDYKAYIFQAGLYSLMRKCPEDRPENLLSLDKYKRLIPKRLPFPRYVGDDNNEENTGPLGK